MYSLNYFVQKRDNDKRFCKIIEIKDNSYNFEKLLHFRRK